MSIEKTSRRESNMDSVDSSKNDTVNIPECNNCVVQHDGVRKDHEQAWLHILRTIVLLHNL